MEDNALADIDRYHILSRKLLDILKLVWPPNSSDLNPIETVLSVMRDEIPPRFGVRWKPISKSCEITQADNLYRRGRLSRKVLGIPEGAAYP